MTHNPTPRPATLWRPLALAGAALALGLAAAPAVAQDAFPIVPPASCGPDDRTETVQGQITLAERFVRAPAAAFNCNLEEVGRYPGEGSGWGWNMIGDCAYVATFRWYQRQPEMQTPGTHVLDISDLSAPTLETVLTSPAMYNSNESLSVSTARNLLLANNVPLNQETEFPLEIYDVSDCRNPQLLFSAEMPDNLRIHGGEFASDGMVYYGVACYCAPFEDYGPAESAFFAIDVSDPTAPKEVARWLPEDPNWKTHWVSINPEETRAYIAMIRLAPAMPHANGLVVLDIEGVRDGGEPKLLSTLFWDDVVFGEFNDFFRKDGHDYILHTDLTGSRSFGGGVQDASACTAGKSGWGYARIIDVTDDQNLTVAARLALEVHDPERCEEFAQDPINQGGYSSAFCDVDAMIDPKLLACGYMEAGLRVFDIRDLSAPKEVAYFKPAPTRTEVRPASFRMISPVNPINTADAVVVPKFHEGGREISFNAPDNGLMTVRFSDAFVAANPDLFPAQ